MDVPLEEALAWLDGHIDFESNVPTRRSLPTLDRMRELMALLGEPQRGYPSIHVTGTNGKGSTSAMITSLLVASGLRTGTYTSPNLSRVNERLAFCGEPIDDESFCEVLDTLARFESMMREPATRFELLTAAAFRWFSDLPVDAAVVEVGLGGTWDCTNVIDGVVSVLTNVSLDHTEVLGPTLEGIARDKSGIARPDRPLIIGERDPRLVAIITESVGSSPVLVRGRDFEVEQNRVAVGGRLLDLRTPGATYESLMLPLHGAHQGENAACALAAAEAFFGRPLAEDIVVEGFGSVRIPGRLEVLGRRPLFLVDGAHNVAGVEALSRALLDGFAVEGNSVAVVGMLAGRDPVAMLAPLRAAGVTTVVTCRPRSPRAMDAAEIAAAARTLDLTAVEGGTVEDAVSMAQSLVDEDGLILVTGSLYVVADARESAAPMIGTHPAVVHSDIVLRS